MVLDRGFPTLSRLGAYVRGLNEREAIGRHAAGEMNKKTLTTVLNPPKTTNSYKQRHKCPSAVKILLLPLFGASEWPELAGQLRDIQHPPLTHNAFTILPYWLILRQETHLSYEL
jgi:hypothetical protein